MPRWRLLSSVSTRAAMLFGMGSAQSRESTFHIIERSFSASTADKPASVRAPYGKRNKASPCRPAAFSKASVAAASCRTLGGSNFDMSPWLKLWLASWCPAANTRCATFRPGPGLTLPSASTLPRFCPNWKKTDGAW